VLGDSEKVKFLPLRASARFPRCRPAPSTPPAQHDWTLGREAAQGPVPGILLYDGRGHGSAQSGVREIAQLNGATVCVEKGTRAPEPHDHLPPGVAGDAAVLDSVRERPRPSSRPLQRHTSDASQLAAVRLQARGGRRRSLSFRAHLQGTARPVVRRATTTGYRRALGAVRLIAAKKNGLRATPSPPRQRQPRVALRRAPGWRGLRSRPGLREDWAVRAVQAAGTTGDVRAQSGPLSALQLEPATTLWTKGTHVCAPVALSRRGCHERVQSG